MKPKAQKAILVIEDDEGLRGLVAHALTRAGYVALSAGSADEASSIWNANKEQIELVVADIVTPGLSGPELVREFAAEKPNLKVIIMSGEQREVALRMTNLVKGAKFLAKPFNISDLMAMIPAL